MSLTENEITAGKAYTVVIPVSQLSFKRRNDAVALVKGINGQREDYFYAPAHPAAAATGYVKNEDPATATARYDGAGQAWTVTIPAAGGRALSDLQAAVSAYGAQVTEVTGAAEAAAQAPAPRRPQASRAQRRAASWLAEPEDGSGFTASERAGWAGK